MNFSMRAHAPNLALGLLLSLAPFACKDAPPPYAVSTKPLPKIAASLPASQPASLPYKVEPSALAQPANAEVLSPGIVSVVTKPGEGSTMPTLHTRAALHVVGYNALDGTKFDDSYVRGRPESLKVSDVFTAMHAALIHMKKGEKRRVWVASPHDDLLPPGVDAAAPIVFDFELVDFADAPEGHGSGGENSHGGPAASLPAGLHDAFKAPASALPDWAWVPPASAKLLTSGVIVQVLGKAKSAKKPTKNSQVLAKYKAWQRWGGKVVQESGAKPSAFAVGESIAGLREALLEMSEGEQARVWISGKQAFGEDGPMGGPLVYELQLVKIVR